MTHERDMSRTTSQPEPLSSPECDLRGLEWMSLNTSDLLDSDLFLMSTGDEFKAAMALICKSWRQVPAGSLPNKDEALAQLSMARDWTSVRTMALRNWVLCTDGRLYHPVVAAKAMEALPHRQEFMAKKSADAERKDRERKDRKDMFARLRAAGIVARYDAKTSELRELVKKLPAVTDSSRDLSRDMSRLGQGHDTTPPLLNTENLSGGAAPAPAPTPAPTPAPRAKGTKAAKEPPVTNEVWEAYAHAYGRRYGTPPVRNASVNGQLAMLVERIGRDEAPNVARFYLATNDPGYVRAMHSTKLLLADAEALRTRWFTARTEIQTAPQSARSQRAAAALAPLGIKVLNDKEAANAITN